MSNSDLINEVINARNALDLVLFANQDVDESPEIDAAVERVEKAEQACRAVGIKLVNV